MTNEDLAEHSSELVHLYRGELGRMTAYRVRLDTTTNWAVGMNAVLLSLALSEGVAAMVAVFPVALLLNLIFLWMEARRYRGFELIRARVRLLEIGLYSPILGSTEPQGWIEELRESLENPTPPVSYFAAVAVRLRHNYLWLIGLAYVAWGVGLFEGQGLEDAQIGPIPGIAVVGLAGVVLFVLVVVSRLHPAPEEG
jgi:uncharacterized membrane protein